MVRRGVVERILAVVAWALLLLLVQYVSFAYLFNPSFDNQGHNVCLVRVPYELVERGRLVAAVLMQPTKSIMRWGVSHEPRPAILAGLIRTTRAACSTTGCSMSGSPWSMTRRG